MIRSTNDTCPARLAAEVCDLAEAAVRLGLSPAGRATEDDVLDVLYRIQRHFVTRLRGHDARTSIARSGGRVSER